MKHTPEQIKLMDDIFNYHIDFNINHTQKANPRAEIFTKKFNVSKDEAQFAINEVCRIGRDLGILIAQEFGFGRWIVVRMDKIKSNNFKEQNGFKKYFEQENETRIPLTNTSTINNYGTIKNLDQSIQETTNKYSQLNKKTSKNSWLEITSWVAGIIATILALYEFWIKNIIK